MQWEQNLILWNHAAIRIMDIRHMEVRSGEALGYQLPANGFLYAAQGDALITMDNIRYETKRFFVLHGGKGAYWTIEAGEAGFDGYLLLYKADLPRQGRSDLSVMLEESSPFRLQYGFQPLHPVMLYEQVKRMKLLWDQESLLDQFKVKAVFYSFVQELLDQIHNQQIPLLSANSVEQAIRYIEAHYTEQLSLQSLAELIGTSPRSLSRRFKQAVGYSPIDYMLRLRMEKVKELLLSTDANLEEIALGVGYPDGYYLGRMFKKYTGISPVRYKQETKNRPKRLHLTLPVAGFDILPSRLRRYIGSDDDIHYQYKRGGSIQMKRNTRSSMAITLLLSLTLLLGACSTGTANSNTAGAGNTSAAATSSTSGASTNSSDNQIGQGQPRTITTINGDIVVPAEPKRIVVDLYLGSLIALGITPVGTPGLNLQNPYYTEYLTGVENIGEYEAISLEKVLTLEPDLIVTGNPELYESFSKIAPTVVVEYGELKNTHEEITYFGKVLGKEKEAAAWLSNYDSRIASAKERVEQVVDKDAEFAVMQYYDKSALAFGNNFGRGGAAVYNELGLNFPAGKEEVLVKEQLVEVSKELISDFAGDYIVLTADSLTVDDLKADPIWGKLDAVKNDRVYIWSGSRSWYFDPIATLSQTEELADWLTGKLAKQ